MPPAGYPAYTTALAAMQGAAVPVVAAPPAPQAMPTPPATPKVNFIMTGAQARHALQEAEQRAEENQKNSGKAFWFYLNKDESCQITFLDGDLAPDGLLALPMVQIHRMLYSGKPQRFVCLTGLGQEPCPLCEGGDQPMLVALLTVIDHRKGKSSQGKEYQDTIKIFAPTQKTLKVLNNIAKKRGGLTHCTFDVTRTGEKEPRVGNLFDFMAKQTHAELVAKYGEDKAKALDYADEIVYRDRATLLKLNLVKQAVMPVGEEKPVNVDDVEDHL
jgi:hypothetical protein